MVGFRILSEETVGDEATLEYEATFADGQTKTEPMRYVRIGNEWRGALDFAERAVIKLSTVLHAQTGAPTDPLEGNQPEGQ